jgi:hypothetical protein
LRDAIKNASVDVTKAVTQVSDSVKRALGGRNGDDKGDNA